MTGDKEFKEPFLERWSRLKQESAAAPPAPPAPAPASGPPPELPAVEELTVDSDFRGFLHPKVEEALKRAALQKLFSDPHFNRMDGLDVYIDDYNIPDPLPEGMLDSLTQYRTLLAQRKATEDERTAREKAETPAAAADVALPQEDPGIVPDPSSRDPVAPAVADATPDRQA
ncbi:MAG TPA: DUF3306 domain-containing protein [Burkholderiales bacterium]